jgi:hypothetical protein
MKYRSSKKVVYKISPTRLTPVRRLEDALEIFQLCQPLFNFRQGTFKMPNSADFPIIQAKERSSPLLPARSQYKNSYQYPWQRSGEGNLKFIEQQNKPISNYKASRTACITPKLEEKSKTYRRSKTKKEEILSKTKVFNFELDLS